MSKDGSPTFHSHSESPWRFTGKLYLLLRENIRYRIKWRIQSGNMHTFIYLVINSSLFAPPTLNVLNIGIYLTKCSVYSYTGVNLLVQRNSSDACNVTDRTIFGWKMRQGLFLEENRFMSSRPCSLVEIYRRFGGIVTIPKTFSIVIASSTWKLTTSVLDWWRVWSVTQLILTNAMLILTLIWGHILTQINVHSTRY